MTDKTFTILIILAHIVWALAVVRLCVRHCKKNRPVVGRTSLPEQES